MTGVYIIQNTVNGKVYIGSASDLVRRESEHRGRLRHGSHHNPHLQRSFNKHGEAAFKWWIAEECAKERLLEREQWWLDMFEPWDDANGYNICHIGRNRLGLPVSEATRAKIRKALTGRKRGPLPESVKAAVSLAHKGIPESPETVARMRVAQRKAWASLSDEQRASRGRPHSEEAKAKISHAQSSRNSMQKLSHKDVAEIRAARASGASMRRIAVSYGVDPSTVSRICSGKRRGYAAI